MKADKKKKKKEKKLETTPGGYVYRPWNRDTDLVQNRKADASKLMNQAALLNSRFSSGSRSRFL